MLAGAKKQKRKRKKEGKERQHKASKTQGPICAVDTSLNMLQVIEPHPPYRQSLPQALLLARKKTLTWTVLYNHSGGSRLREEGEKRACRSAARQESTLWELHQSNNCSTCSTRCRTSSHACMQVLFSASTGTTYTSVDKTKNLQRQSLCAGVYMFMQAQLGALWEEREHEKTSASALQCFAQSQNEGKAKSTAVPGSAPTT